MTEPGYQAICTQWRRGQQQRHGGYHTKWAGKALSQGKREATYSHYKISKSREHLVLLRAVKNLELGS